MSEKKVVGSKNGLHVARATKSILQCDPFNCIVVLINLTYVLQL
jgi:hypothetical protein